VTSSSHLEQAGSAEVGSTILDILVNFIGGLVRSGHVLGLAVRQGGYKFPEVEFAFLHICISFVHAAASGCSSTCLPLVDRHIISHCGIRIGADNLGPTGNFKVDVHITVQLKASEIGDSISFAVEVGWVSPTKSPVVCGGAHSQDIAEEPRDKVILE